MKGLSFLISIGCWGGIYVFTGKTVFRLVIGFVSFSIFKMDLDCVLVKMRDKSQEEANEN